jgi:magnesium transporter
METNVVSIPTTEDKEEATRQINKYDLIALPVVDHEDRLVGIVTVDDAIDVLQSEVTEDISRMAAMEPIEDSYFKTPVFVHAKKRILWLIFLMFSATVTGVILQHFENAISVLPVLVGSIPMLMGTGGNSGSQSATIITRGIALGEVSFKDIFKVIFKEFRVSIIVSFALSLINIIRILAMYKIGILVDIGGHSVFIIAAVISFALLLVIIIAKFIGCTLPLLADKVGLDPALMASPIISTIVDACAVVIYFNIATAWLGI